jgi:hypothetical protein
VDAPVITYLPWFELGPNGKVAALDWDHGQVLARSP